MCPSSLSPSDDPRSERPEAISRREFCARSLAATATAATAVTTAATAGAAAGPLRALAAAEAGGATGPSRKWTIFVVQHAHIDVGYTERQEIIADQHAQFVRQAVALALSPAQKDRDEAARFKFTCEGFWQVEQFLARATPEEKEGFLRALREGAMELTACRFHLTELLDQEMLRRSLRPAAEFARREGIPLLAAMGCDINGLSWGMADALAEVGVRWLSMNINNHHGGYPFGRPLVPFWWEAPSGKRILAWSGMAYHKANLFGLMGGQTPDGDPGVPGFRIGGTNTVVDVRDISLAERKLLPLLAWLEGSGYPHDFLPLMGSGLYTDNSPPGDECCRLIAAWNAKHGDRVRVRTATLREFFEHIERGVRDLPVHRGEWTDWWSEGVAATPLDTLVFRNAQRNRRVIDLLDPAGKVVPPERLALLDEKLMLYAEHTFGYSHTSLSTLLMHQIFLRKTQHAVEADELAGRSLYEILRTRGEGMFVARRPFEYRVLNPLATAARAVASLPLDFWEEPTVREGFRVVDDRGRVVPHQVEGSPRGWNVAAVVELAPGEGRGFRLEPPGEPAPVAPPPGQVFENAWYRVSWEDGKGLTSLVDRQSGAEVLDGAAGALGSPVYQIFPGGNRGPAGTIFGPRTRPRDEVTAGKCVAIHRVAWGPVYERWEIRYEVPGASEYVLVATFFRDLPQIELVARVRKTDVRDPEGMYVLFPFRTAGGVWHLDKPGSPIRPGVDQLPGSCTDYYLVQHGAALSGKECGVAWTTLDAPMVQIGKLRLWDYSTGIEPVGPLYSWLTNNKWETNFRISAGGAYDFRYVIRVGAGLADSEDAVAEVRALSYPPLAMRK
jgi:hypothetical protein